MSWKWEGKSWSSNWEGWGNKGWGYKEDEDEVETFYVPGIGRVKGKSLLDISSEDLPKDFYDDVPHYKIVNGHVVVSDE